MTNYRKSFEEHLPAIEQAIKQMPGDIDDIVPGMTRARLQRFFQRFSIQLGRIDKRGAKHPQHLMIDNQIAPTLLLNSIDNAINHLNAGAATFVQHSFSLFVRIQSALDQAVGTDVEQTKKLASSVAADLTQAVVKSDELIAKANQSAKTLDELGKGGQKSKEGIDELIEKIDSDAARITKIRASLEEMTNPDGRRSTSLETLARKAKKLIGEIDKAKEEMGNKAIEINKLLESATDSESGITQINEDILKTKLEAEKILNLSSQAGLAASYKQESDRLKDNASYYTYILYGVTILTLLIAVCYVLPAVSSLITNENKVDGWQAFSLTLLRVSTLAPLVYALFFTTKRISQLEVLRMDYAEKAAASLAYSGYREQMENDTDLLQKLKESLLIKFSEHPERLLNKEKVTSKLKIETSTSTETDRDNPQRNNDAETSSA